MSELEGGVIIGKMAAAGKGASATGGVAKMTMSSVLFSGKGLGIGLGFWLLGTVCFWHPRWRRHLPLLEESRKDLKKIALRNFSALISV